MARREDRVRLAHMLEYSCEAKLLESHLIAWFDNYRAQMWDKQIEEDLEAGRLDAVLAEVDAEYKGRIRLDPPEGSAAKECEPAWLTLREVSSALVPAALPAAPWRAEPS